MCQVTLFYFWWVLCPTDLMVHSQPPDLNTRRSQPCRGLTISCTEIGAPSGAGCVAGRAGRSLVVQQDCDDNEQLVPHGAAVPMSPLFQDHSDQDMDMHTADDSGAAGSVDRSSGSKSMDGSSGSESSSDDESSCAIIVACCGHGAGHLARTHPAAVRGGV